MTHPQNNLTDIARLDPTERTRILGEFNNTYIPYNKDTSLVQLIAAQATVHPDNIALVYEEEQLSYRALQERSNQWAHYLQDQGVGKNTLVACCMDQSIEKIVCMLAIAKTGAAYIPFDTTHPRARLEYMLEDTKATALIISSRYESRFSAYNGHLIQADAAPVKTTVQSLPTSFTTSIDPASLIYVIYTSGTTGKPKGVMVEHQQVTNFLQCYADYLQLTTTDKALQFTSTSFDASATDLWLPLAVGATLYLYPNNRLVGDTLWQYIKKHQITALPFIAPSVLSTLPVNEEAGSLTIIGVGGEPCPETVVKKWQERVRLVNVYGPTETTIAVSSFIYDHTHPATTIGKPIANTFCYILDAGLQLLPIGSTGELFIGGAQVARGYLNQPDATIEHFLIDPFASPEALKNGWTRMYKSGDLARFLPDGNIELLGRTDTQVKIRGVRIELSEIENTLLKLPGVKQAIVIVQEDKYNERILVGCIIHEQGKIKGETARDTADELRKALQSQLPSQMVPASFIFLEEFPMNEHGKIDKQLLKPDSPEFIEASFPEGVSFNECEQVITAVWSEVLQRKDINLTDNFFELGGHSILLTHVYKRLPAVFRAKLTLPDLYEYDTIQHLAAHIRAGLTTQDQVKREEEDNNYLLSDIFLSPDITISGTFDPAVLSNPAYIFLTGATGFVGAHLLAELLTQTQAEVFCLVRAADEQAAFERIHTTFRNFAITIAPAAEKRIKPVAGDLTQPLLGLPRQLFDELAAKVDVIYHSGSSVSYIEPYNYMKSANIGGLNEVIKLAAAHKLKCLILLSTVAVFAWGHYDTHKLWMSEDDNIMQSLKYLRKDIGYAKTKWVMEQVASLAASKGLPTMLFRLGFVMCHSQTGATALDQMWAMLIKHCHELKAYPMLVNIKEELITVDYACEAIVHITRQENAIGRKFHLTPLTESDMSWIEFFNKLNEYFGFQLKPTMYHDWLEMWKNNEQDIFYPYLSLLTDDVVPGKSLAEVYQNSYHFLCDNTLSFLKNTNIKPPVITKEIMEKYLNYLGINTQ